MALPPNMILVVYHTMYIVIYDFIKITFLYIHVHISLLLLWQISLWWLLFLSIKYLSVCLLNGLTSKILITTWMENSVCEISWKLVAKWLRNRRKSFTTVNVKPIIVWHETVGLQSLHYTSTRPKWSSTDSIIYAVFFFSIYMFYKMCVMPTLCFCSDI